MNDDFKPKDLSEFLLFIVNRMWDENDRLILTETVTDEGVNILLTVESDDDEN